MKHINAVNRKTFGSDLLRLPLNIALVAVLVASVAGCAQRVDTPRSQMTVPEARMALEKSLRHRYGYTDVEVKFGRKKFVASGLFKGTPSKFTVEYFSPRGGSVEVISYVTEFTCCGDQNWLFDSGPYAMDFIDAMFALNEAAMAPDPEESDFAAFTVSAQGWLAASPKPKMTDDALTYRLLAEDAYKRKDFTAALDAYSLALIRHPLWPDGHYNAALLAAEANDFELASRHMRRYLVLSPDAKDAVSAKQKLLLWQEKADPGGTAARALAETYKTTFGLIVGKISKEAREHFVIPASVNGWLVVEVIPGSLGADAGLQPGNVIVGVDRVAVTKPIDAGATTSKSAGDDLVLRLRVWTKKDGTRYVFPYPPAQAPGKMRLGVRLGEIDKEARERFAIPASVNGVLVGEVMPGSRADDAGLQPGNVIVEVDRVAVTKPIDVLTALDRNAGDLVLRLWNKDGTRDVVVKERKDN